jgi:hypothetical protein
VAIGLEFRKNKKWRYAHRRDYTFNSKGNGKQLPTEHVGRQEEKRTYGGGGQTFV